MPVPTWDNSLGTRDQIDRKWGPDSRKVATLQFYTKSDKEVTFEVIAEHYYSKCAKLTKSSALIRIETKISK